MASLVLAPSNPNHWNMMWIRDDTGLKNMISLLHICPTIYLTMINASSPHGIMIWKRGDTLLNTS